MNTTQLRSIGIYLDLVSNISVFYREEQVFLKSFVSIQREKWADDNGCVIFFEVIFT